MDSTQPFRDALAARVLRVLGATAIAASPVACTHGGTDDGAAGSTSGTTSTVSSSVSEGTGGSAGAGGASTGDAGGAGAGSPGGGSPTPPVVSCFDLQSDGAACPTDLATALAIFVSEGCVTSFEVYQVVSGPVSSPPGQCCYETRTNFCSGPTGRPFLVDGLARVAHARRGEGGAFSGGLPVQPDVGGLTADERRALCDAWTADAQQEHASVAAFARFALSLLAAGAPADLCAAAHEAALDEVRHARLCFALASAYAGEEIAPGPFPFDGQVGIDGSLAALAAAAVAEGCVGETLSACLAAEQLAAATDPAVRAVLSEIAADEARHAELAFRTVAWAVRAGRGDVRAAVGRAFAQACQEEAPAPGASSAALAAHGRLDAGAGARARSLALRDVVAVAAQALTRDGEPGTQST